jgi:hypothetical protein
MKTKQSIYAVALFILLLCSSCGLKTANEIGLSFSTEQSTLPDTLNWRTIGFAKELVNTKEMVVVISGGKNPIPLNEWDNFKPSLPYKKNIDRNLLFQKTAFYRSPNTSANCTDKDCIREIVYKNYTWVELAKPICVDFVGGKTDILKPEKGRLVIKTIQKCQAIMFTDSIFQLTDNQGNYFAMHATETGKPDTTAVLPKGWTLQKIMLKEPLIISPFGGGHECYFNIIGDHLGQGYHQYIFAAPTYPPNDL